MLNTIAQTQKDIYSYGATQVCNMLERASSNSNELSYFSESL